LLADRFILVDFIKVFHSFYILDDLLMAGSDVVLASVPGIGDGFGPGSKIL
jgi:hypothetical protein